MIYEPQEDSLLLRKHIAPYAKGIVLDMGTGSGIQAVEASKSAEIVIALDVNKEAIKQCKKEVSQKNILFFKSNLFQFLEENFLYWDSAEKNLEIYLKSSLKDREKVRVLSKKHIKFNLIIFNPPYLPRCKEDPDVALDGGEEGWELLQKFFHSAGNYLAAKGTILIVFSSLSHPRRVREAIGKAGFTYELLDMQHVFFEDLFVYRCFR